MCVGTEVDSSATQSPPNPSPPAGTDSDSRRKYTYSLKIINPKKRSQFVVEKFRRPGMFKSPRELRLCILMECKGSVPDNTEFDVRYFKGGRGSAKVWIKSEKDLNSMYETYHNEQKISLWCLGPEKEDGTTSVSNTNISNNRKLPKQGSKRQAIRNEVEDIFTSLKEAWFYIQCGTASTLGKHATDRYSSGL